MFAQILIKSLPALSFVATSGPMMVLGSGKFSPHRALYFLYNDDVALKVLRTVYTFYKSRGLEWSVLKVGLENAQDTV